MPWRQRFLLLNDLGERVANHQVQHDVRLPAFLADFINGADILMVDGGRGAGIAQKLFDFRIGHIRGERNLDGDVSAEFLVEAAIDDAE
jgi:hypothetical protein